MNIVLLAQEEPAYMGPMLAKLLEAEKKNVKLVVVAPLRGAGERRDSMFHRLEDLASALLIFGTEGTAHILWRRIIFSARNLHWISSDCYSIGRAARRMGLPVFRTRNVNDNACLEAIRRKAPDIIINQTDQYIRKELLRIPKKGLINRHGSLLPKNRGRLASFWSHIDGEYGVTVHYVNSTIDGGPIIYQQKLKLDPTQNYHRIISQIFEASDKIISRSLRKVENQKFKAKKQLPCGSIHQFPSLKDALKYRRILSKRRCR
jgi:folate-dependent phosphoribosylglycinamide formyltransferase PurN